MKGHALFTIFLALCLARPSVAANDPPFFSTLTVRDGLPTNIINSIAQDQYDFIWVGTANGLCRYDGHRFTTFKKNDTNSSLPANEISSLLVDGDYLWVGTWKGLCKINTRTFEVVRVTLGGHRVIRALHKGQHGTIWIGTATGLVRYNADGSLAEFTSQNSNLSHNTIRSILTDRYNNLWVGTYDKLNKLPEGRNLFVAYDLKADYKTTLKNNLICDIKQSTESDSMLWVGTETGLCLFNIFTGRFRHFTEKNTGWSNEVIKNIYQDGSGSLWLGTDFGLNVYSPGSKSNEIFFHHPQLPYSIANNVIWQIFEDSGGVIWFVTSNGLSKLNKYRNYYSFHEVSYSLSGQRIGNQVKSILITRDGTTWLATLHGVIRIDGVTGKREVYDTESPENKRILLNNVYALEEDDLGRVWIGTAGGINVWDESKQKMFAITSNPTNGLVTNYIAKFTKGTDGSFWVSAWEGGLFKTTGNFENIGSIRFELVDEFGSEKNVSGSNAIWAIHYNELFRIDLQTHRSIIVPAFNRVSNQRDITSLYFSRKGSLWAATQNGLIEYRVQRDTALFYPITMGSDVILASIIEDAQGNIWGASNGFIIKFDITSHRAEIFPLDKDMPLKSFFDGCATINNAGELVFGGDNGYVLISPSSKPLPFLPEVRITSLEINNHKVNAAKLDSLSPLTEDVAFSRELSLNYAQRSIAVEFSTLHYWQPGANTYAYRLEGHDQDWTYVSGAKNFAVYSNLPAGDYTLKVRGTNNYGVWSDKTATLAISVSPPLFLSKGFLVLYVALVSIFIFFALRFYSSRLHLRNEVKIARLEKEHAEEIVQAKQQFFANISHELRTPISLILPPIQQTLKKENLDEDSRSMLLLAEKNSQRLLRVVNQILDFRKLEHDHLELKITSFDLVAFCRNLFLLFSNKAARDQIHFTFQPWVNVCELWADTDKVETILYNLLSNAFKFTPPEGSIDLSVRVLAPGKEFLRGAVEIRVTDTGIGIPPDDRPKIFDRFFQTAESRKMEGGSGIGLTLAAEYTKLHHGRISVESIPAKGSVFTVTLPLGNIHFPVDSTHGTDEINLVATRSDNERPYLYDLNSDKPLILIAEDNTDMIDYLRIHLKNEYHLIFAQNGEEALAKANNFVPEIIISDIMMPVMDGLTLCKKIKENPRTSHIGIILLTAKGLTSNKVEGIRMGADVYITKPFEMELLDASIDHLLKRKQELSDYFRTQIMTQPTPSVENENVDDKFVKKVMNVIEANISNPEFGVEMLSREIGMSSTHLYRKLKSLTQLSANEIIKKYRVKKASLLLKNKEGNISEIMYDVGFSNRSYFSKCFKAEFGLTPRDFQTKMSKSTVNIDDIGNLSSESGS